MDAKLIGIGLALTLGSVGCAPQYVATTPDDPLDVPVRTAFFAANPDGLDMAFKEGCNAPGDEFTRPDRNTARCNILPTPESAAFLLTQFDAQLEVPKLIVQKVTRPAQDGYEVEMSYFAEILAKTGNRQRVYIRSRTLDKQIDFILMNSGGQPIEG